MPVIRPVIRGPFSSVQKQEASFVLEGRVFAVSDPMQTMQRVNDEFNTRMGDSIELHNNSDLITTWAFLCEPSKPV